MESISRRDLIKGASVAGMAAGALGVAGTAAQADEATYTQIAGNVYSSSSWRVKPEAIADDLITQTYEADVCVMGLGHAGGTAAVELSEEGYSVVALEKQTKDAFRTTGHDCGHINSKLSETYGGGLGYDVVEFFNNWMLNSANAANPGLIMKYAKGGETVDWWEAKTNGQTTGDETGLVFQPANDERPNIQTEVGPFKFYCTTVRFDDTYAVLNGGEAAEAANEDTHFLYGYAGVQLVSDESGAVTGVIAQNVETEEYIQVNCKAVVLTCGMRRPEGSPPVGRTRFSGASRRRCGACRPRSRWCRAARSRTSRCRLASGRCRGGCRCAGGRCGSRKNQSTHAPRHARCRRRRCGGWCRTRRRSPKRHPRSPGRRGRRR